MEIVIIQKKYSIIFNILEKSSNENDLKILTKSIIESNEFKENLINYCKSECKCYDLHYLFQKLINYNIRNFKALIKLCEILEKLLFDSDSQYEKNVFLHSLLFSLIILVLYDDKQEIYKDRIIEIFLKFKILSDSELKILEKIKHFYLLGFYYMKNTYNYESALDNFIKSGMNQNDDIIIQIKNLLLLKSDSKQIDINKSDINDINDSDKVKDSNYNDFDNSMVIQEIENENNVLNLDYPEDFDFLQISPLMTNKKINKDHFINI
jgi:hypothetical protein